MDEEATDRYLGQLLRLERADPDERFVSRTLALVIADERMRASRSAAWRRFGLEAVSGGAVLIAFLLLGRLAGEPDGSTLSLVSPGTAAMLLLGLWLAIMQDRMAAGIS